MRFGDEASVALHPHRRPEAGVTRGGPCMNAGYCSAIPAIFALNTQRAPLSLRSRHYAYRWRERSFAFSASISLLRGGAVVASERMRRSATSVTSSTARLKTASFALEGRLDPLSLRTNCSADARISSSVAGGSKLASVLMLRHMTRLYQSTLEPDRYCRVSSIEAV